MTRPVGIDVSYWNGDITKALVGQSFAFCRASVAASVDGTYAAHSAAVRKAGLVLGAYHYLVYGPGGGRQAAVFLRAAGNADLLCMDIESTALRYPQLGRSFIVNLRKTDPLHRRILLYSSQGTWPGDLGQDANWVARWGSVAPSMPWTFWQNQGQTLDRDVFNGSLAQLKAFALPLGR